MPAAPTPEEIITAVQASGYLMEQEVATRVEALGYHVRTNSPFKDPEEAKSREIDALAIRRVHHDEEARVSVFIEFVIECKSTSNPYVFISRNKNARDRVLPPREVIFPVSEFERREPLPGNKMRFHTKPAFFELGADAEHYHFCSPKKAVQFCRIDRNGKGWQAGHSGLYDSIFLPLMKAFDARLGGLPKWRNEIDWAHVWILVPVVVVRGSLYEIDSSKTPVEPTLVSHVTFTRDFKNGDQEKRYAIEFVGEDFLEGFIEKVENFAGDLVRKVTAQGKEITKRNREWVSPLPESAG